MSEPVLKSIIQLLAISATLDGNISESERGVIHNFIYENINDENAHSFVSLFNDYTSIALAGNVEAENICKRINQELNQKQKLIVLSHLIELAVANGNVEADAEAFAAQVAQAFNIPAEEYDLLLTFITNEAALIGGLPYTLVITGEPLPTDARQIVRQGFTPLIGILRIPSQELYLLKFYEGTHDTFLNGVRLKDRHVYSFSNGAVIRSEVSAPVYYSDVVSKFLQGQQDTRILFEAKHLYYAFANGKLGLRDINLYEESGRLVGIMGASGSGKSTLLNVLNGNEYPVGGKVMVNGIDIHDEAQKAKIKGVMGYVPQDDLLVEELTVYQNMYYAAKLCFRHSTEADIHELIQRTLQSLGLAEVSHLRVGNPLQKTISGGQRKRLNIGLELLREPAILFVDEPTSGLSSNDSENIMDLLKELSLKGKLVFVVIHQPSSDIFKMFDKLIILDVGGFPIYYGQPVESVRYFKTLADQVNAEESVCGRCGNITPEQIFSIIETKVVDEYGRYTHQRKISPAQWHKHFTEIVPFLHRSPREYPPVRTHLSVPTRFKQWWIFACRDFRAKLSNRQYMVISLLEAPVLAFILAFVVRYYPEASPGESARYWLSANPNIPAYIFMSIIVALFIGLTVSAEEIIRDARMLKRERFLHLSRGSYLFSKIFILFGFSALQTGTFILIGNTILGIHGLWWQYWLVLFSTACFANLMGLVISDSFNSVVTVYILIPILLIPQLILGGIVVKFDDINPKLAAENKVPLISEIMASRWAFEALMVAQFKDNAFEKNFYALDKAMAQAQYATVYYLPALESTLSHLQTNSQSQDKSVRKNLPSKLQLLRYELMLEQKRTPHLSLSGLEQLTTLPLTAAQVSQINTHLQRLKAYYQRRYQHINTQKDRLVADQTRTSALRDRFVEYMKRHHNDMVEELVKNTDEPNRVHEFNGKLIQKVYPIFHDPVADNPAWWDFRTHFYAPTKQFFGKTWDTVWFNVAIIWVMSLGLYPALYYSVFRESVRTFAVAFSRKKRK